MFLRTFPNLGDRKLASVRGGRYPRWGPDGRTLFYRATDGWLTRRRVQAAGSSIDLGSPTVLTRLPDAPAILGYPYDVGADGRILALTLPGGGAQGLALNVLMNWQAALERGADGAPSR